MNVGYMQNSLTLIESTVLRGGIYGVCSRLLRRGAGVEWLTDSYSRDPWGVPSKKV